MRRSRSRGGRKIISTPESLKIHRSSCFPFILLLLFRAIFLLCRSFFFYLFLSFLFSTLLEGSNFPPFWLFSARVTIAKMRSDSGEILAKIPPFILISFLSSVCTSSPTSFGNPIYTNPRARTLLEDSPGGRLYPRIVERFFGSPVGLSSPFTSPKCSIYNIVTLLESAAIFFPHLHKGWISSSFLIRSLYWLRGR